MTRHEFYTGSNKCHRCHCIERYVRGDMYWMFKLFYGQEVEKYVVVSEDCDEAQEAVKVYKSAKWLDPY